MEEIEKRLEPLKDAGIVTRVSSYVGGYGDEMKVTVVIHVSSDPLRHEPVIRELLQGIETPVSIRAAS